MNNNNEPLHIDIYCRASDRRNLELLGFAAHPDFRSAETARMTRATGSRPLIAALIGHGMDGAVLFGYFARSEYYPPAAIASDGKTLSYVLCDPVTRDPIIRVTPDGRMIGVTEALAYWPIAQSAMSILGLKFADNNHNGSNERANVTDQVPPAM
jgi:hypothetical protein